MSFSATLTAPLVAHIQALSTVASLSGGVVVGEAPSATAPVIRVDLLSSPIASPLWDDLSAREWSFRIEVQGLQTAISTIRTLVDAIGAATHDVLWTASGYDVTASRITDVAETAFADGDTRIHRITLRLDVSAES